MNKVFNYIFKKYCYFYRLCKWLLLLLFISLIIINIPIIKDIDFLCNIMNGIISSIFFTFVISVLDFLKNRYVENIEINKKLSNILYNLNNKAKILIKEYNKCSEKDNCIKNNFREFLNSLEDFGNECNKAAAEMSQMECYNTYRNIIIYNYFIRTYANIINEYKHYEIMSKNGSLEKNNFNSILQTLFWTKTDKPFSSLFKSSLEELIYLNGV